MIFDLWPALAGWLTALAVPAAAVVRVLVDNAIAATAVSIVLLFACRERGTEHSWLGTQGARALLWGVPVAGVAWWLAPALPIEVLARVWAAATLGMVLLPQSAGQNLEETSAAYPASWTAKIPRPQKLGYLWLAGMGRLAFLSIALQPSQLLPPLWVVLGGLAMPAGYLVAMVMPALPWRFRTAQEWGEGLYGLLLGPVLTVALRT
ncbi:hypothetical protein [Azospirillum picis]|uniref:Uncharacterized protein n=1 Tax=Azospirillum picis TaxID=488438 RepID=A0ABU0MUP1_9PROT|nr:hypothetical protein [Azospirillum picis]MBP2303336.1 hypothetical protein [Azospirillum picis]MDQ0537182.1 hypothetical protein [Azospirillum picis]